MAEPKRISEAAVTYGLPVVDLADPLIIERDGQPVAVVLPYEDYAELKAEAAERAQQRELAWQHLEDLMARVHARTTSLTPEEIEAEITVAWQEAREERRARRSRS
ncbi:MAG: type II toxin-antitoxin system Phd/YefM family antitoxin [Chloroflexi bacterium]|nr:type II toxin-antitoxin system Phd/YefM family antitoxin [Chloroflexota bacterium]